MAKDARDRQDAMVVLAEPHLALLVLAALVVLTVTGVVAAAVVVDVVWPS